MLENVPFALQIHSPPFSTLLSASGGRSKWTLLSALLALWLLLVLIQGIREEREVRVFIFQVPFQQSFLGKADSPDSRPQFLLGDHLSLTLEFLVVTLSCPVGLRTGNNSRVFHFSL